jgi:decaprenyl-phosphate phosphoribosyltransferase
MQLLKNIIILLRPHQYTKNLFIFLPAFFHGNLLHPDVIINCFIAFIAFCMFSSAVYVLNDISDVNEDRLHPEKRHRPIADNRISKKAGYLMIVLLLAVGCAIAYRYKGLMEMCLIYLVLNILYSLKLKHIAIIDISIISAGFVIRLFAGSAVTAVPLTNWIVVMTFLLALFLGLAKRRDDVIINQGNGQQVRKSIDGYTLELINVSTSMIAGVIIVAYLMYALQPETIARFKSDKLYLSAIFVVLGILRYMQIIYVENKSGAPSKILLRDRFLQIVLVGWIAFFAFIVYL